MPLYMRLGKLPGPNHRMSMPMGPFRTHTTPVNVRSLDAFDAGTEVTPGAAEGRGRRPHARHPVKILGTGELKTKLTVHAHGFSQARGRADRGRRRHGRRDRRRRAGGRAEAGRQARSRRPPPSRMPSGRRGAGRPSRRSSRRPPPSRRPRPQEPEAEARTPVAGDHGRGRRGRRGFRRGVGAPELPQRLAGPRPPHEAAVHGGDARGVPVRVVPAGAGRQLGRAVQPARRPGRRAQPADPVLGRRAAAAVACSRWASCPTSRRRSSCRC